MTDLENNLNIMIEISNKRAMEILELEDKIKKLNYIIELKDITINQLKNNNFNGEFL